MTEVEPGVEIDEEVFEPGESHGTVIRLSLTAALGGFLFGYDSSVINGAVAAITAHFSASAGVLGFTVSSALLGAAAGALGAGRVADRYGRLPAMRVAAALDGGRHDGGDLPAFLGVTGVVEQFDYRHPLPNLAVRQSAAPAMLVVHDGRKAVGSELLEGILHVRRGLVLIQDHGRNRHVGFAEELLVMPHEQGQGFFANPVGVHVARGAGVGCE